MLRIDRLGLADRRVRGSGLAVPFVATRRPSTPFPAKGTAARFKKHERGIFVAGKGA